MKFSMFRKSTKESAEVEDGDSRTTSPTISSSHQRKASRSQSTAGSTVTTTPRLGRSQLNSSTSTYSSRSTSLGGNRNLEIHSSLNPATEQPSENEGKMKLKVVVDPIPTDFQRLETEFKGGCKIDLKNSFDIYVDSLAPVKDVQDAIHEKLGSRGLYSLGCYKVQIPLLAHHQANTYTENFGIPVHLLAHFPAYNLFDSSHLITFRSQEASGRCRMGGSQGLNAVPLMTDHQLKIHDWWPQVVTDTDENISVIVRLGPVERSQDNPMTLLAHFSNGRTKRGFYPSSNQSPDPSANTNARPPLVFELARNSTVHQLKTFVLQAQGKDTTQVDKVTIWRVDMSWEEMLSCEAYGGLRDGGMPWPYPPNAPSPVALDSSRPHLSDYFPESNVNTNLVSMYVWIDPEVDAVSIPSDRDTPFFSFPMSFAISSGSRNHSNSKSHSRPQSQSSENITTLNLGSNQSLSTPSNNQRGNYRPVTAPAAISPSLSSASGAGPAKPHAFGSRSTVATGKAALRSKSRTSSAQRSPLSEQNFNPTLGLAVNGITTAGPVMQSKLSISSDYSPEDDIYGGSSGSSIDRLSRTSTGSESSGTGLITPPPPANEVLPSLASLKLQT